MAFEAKGKDLTLDEYNYGMGIPFTLSGDIQKDDQFILRFRTSLQAPVLFEIIHTVTEVNDTDTFEFVLTFTKEQSYKLPKGDYVYSLSQYRDGELFNTLIKSSKLTVKGVA